MGPAMISAVGGVLSGLGGLFGKKPKQITPKQQVMGTAEGAREAAEAYGFNPLTLLGANIASGQLAGGTPPLASAQLLADSVAQMTPEAEAERKRQQEADQVQLELAKQQYEANKIALAFAPDSAVNAMNGVFGRRSSIVQQASQRPAPSKIGGNEPVVPYDAENPVAPGRPKQVMPMANGSGMTELQNPFTDNRPIVVPGDGGEPWGIDELLTAVVVGGPQVAWNLAMDELPKEDGVPTVRLTGEPGDATSGSWDWTHWPNRGWNPFNATNYYTSKR